MDDQPRKRTNKAVENKQAQAAILMVTHDRATAEAELDISTRTMARWLADPTFQKMLTDLRSERFTEVADQLGQLGTLALSELRTLLTSSTTTPGIRLRAIDITLSKFIAAREFMLTTDRVAAIEATLREIQEYQSQ